MSAPRTSAPSIRRRLSATGLFLASALVLGGCAHDRILPADVRCGDGRLSPGEECDTTSPGCVQCRIREGYSCTENACAPICGDGLLTGDEECDPPDSITCDGSCRAVVRESECALNGYYAVRQMNYSRDTIVGQVQSTSTWYLFRFAQTGAAFRVEEGLTCGFHVTGSVTVSLGDAALSALLYANPQATGPHGPHRGTFTRGENGCQLSFDRFYLIRGLAEDFLPADFLGRPELSTLRPLPYETDPVHPTGAHTEGALDVDHDGLPGITLQLSGNLSGTRATVQRDWYEYSPDPAVAVPENAVEFRVASAFDNEESVLAVTNCSGPVCSLLAAGSIPARDLPGYAVFRFLGKDIDDPHVAGVVAGIPGRDEAADLATCEAIRKALPHESKTP